VKNRHYYIINTYNTPGCSWDFITRITITSDGRYI